jgi:hypothetical protein
MLNESIAKLGVGNQIIVRDVAELLLQSVDLSDAIAKTGKNNIGALLGLCQEELHV